MKFKIQLFCLGDTWSDVYETCNADKCYHMYKHLIEAYPGEKDKYFRCVVLFGETYRPICL